MKRNLQATRRRPSLLVAPLALSALLCATLGGGATGAGSTAQGAEVTGAGNADVYAIVARAKSAKASDQQQAIYDLWNHWEVSDPIAISAALRALADDASIAPASRALATAFAATARLQLGDPTEAKALAARAGFVQTWLVVGPFDHAGRAGFGPELGPELDRRGALSLSATYDGQDHRGVHWRPMPVAASPFGAVDLAATMRPSKSACILATTFVAQKEPEGKKAKAKAIAGSIYVGASGSVRVYWNGETVVDDPSERALTYDREATAVTIEPGWNRLLVKVCGMDRSPSVALRVADANGAPIEGVRVEADPRHVEGAPPPPKATEKSSKDLPQLTDGKPIKAAPPLPDAKKDDAKKDDAKKDDAKKDEDKEEAIVITAPKTLGASRTLFQELIARVRDEKKPAAADLEALARYLRDTSGDDPAHIESRDLARHAADAAPTVARLLLAGELAEDRNQRRGYVDRAVALEADSADVLYAQGSLAATGPDPDSAFPFFAAALKANPDHLQAIAAQADLLTTVGLRRSARAEIETALGVRPRARVLLSRYAALLAVDSPKEAIEARARHDELSLTNGAYFGVRLAAAVDARDLEAARALVVRWRSIDPAGDSPVKDGAGALERLGDSLTAVSLYKAAMDVSPDDPSMMIGLADVQGRRGERDAQLALYKQVYARWPQYTELRDYLEQATPSKPREDEAFAEASETFLPRRTLPANGFDTRILSQVSVTTVESSGLAGRFHQVVYQPLTVEAAVKGRQYAFGFQGDVETVTLRVARIYHKDGKIDDASSSGELANNDPSVSMYTSSKVFYVMLPNVQAGDVVELRYRVEDTAPRNAFGDYFGEVTYLQSLEPTAHLEYVLRLPKGRALTIGQPALPGVKFSDEEKGELRVMHWSVDDVAGKLAEQDMPPWPEVNAHVHVSTYKDWDALGQWYWGLIKDEYVADDAVRAKVKELTKGRTTDEAKARAIYDWVVQQTRYVALEFGIKGFQPYRCAQIFARGFGDCKDKATLIVTMLKEAGIEAVPVLVRTNLRGDFETTIPSLAIFDHMIAYVPSLDTYLDGTAEDHGSTELPAMDRGALAARVEAGKITIVHLPSPPPSASVASLAIDVTLDADLGGTLDVSMESSGIFAPRLRTRYRTTSSNDKSLGEDLPSDFAAAATWSAVTPGTLDDLEISATVKAKGKSTAIGRPDGDERSLPVAGTSSLLTRWAPLSDRKQDFRIWSTQTVDHRFTYRLPANAKIDRVAEAKKGSSPFGTYAVEIESSKGLLKVHAHLELAVTRVKPADYAAFRAFLKDADAALQQRILVSVSKK